MQLDLLQPLREQAYQAECRVARCAFNEQVVMEALRHRCKLEGYAFSLQGRADRDRDERAELLHTQTPAGRLYRRWLAWQAQSEQACRALEAALRDLGEESSGLQWRQERLHAMAVAEELARPEYGRETLP